MKNYRKADTCRNCQRCVICGEWDDPDTLWCCKTIEEAKQRRPPMCPDPGTEWYDVSNDERFGAMEKWADDRTEVREGMICDEFIRIAANLT